MAARRRPGRAVTGILLLDKPVGLTSNTALQKAKSLYRARKAGHTGSLDKAASGLLPLCFGAATKFSGFLLNADKRYLVACKLGVQTSTGDAEGEVVFQGEVPALSKKEVEAALAKFRGPILQVPPMFSALKRQGQRLYQLARRGLEVEREPREVVIRALNLLAQRKDELELEVLCSKGTYIRTLAEDLGKELGCGAHVKSLARVGVGSCNGADMLTLDELEAIAADGGTAALDARLLPIDAVLDDLPAVRLVDTVAFYLRQGQPVVVPKAPTQGLLRLYDRHEQFLGVGEMSEDGRVAPKRLLA